MEPFLLRNGIRAGTGVGVRLVLLHKKGRFKVLPPECDPATHDLKEQIEFQKNQITELMEKYPEAFYIWNDALDDGINLMEPIKAASTEGPVTSPS